MVYFHFFQEVKKEEEGITELVNATISQDELKLYP